MTTYPCNSTLNKLGEQNTRSFFLLREDEDPNDTFWTESVIDDAVIR